MQPDGMTKQTLLILRQKMKRSLRVERLRFLEDAVVVPLQRARFEGAALATANSDSEEGATAAELVDKISVEEG